MRNLGKEAKTLLLGITIVCVLSLLFTFGISSVLTKSFQRSLVNHDYGVAGYLLNHDDGFVLSAFTDEKGEEDILCGLNALSLLGYHETVSIRLLPAVSVYQNKVLLSLCGLLLFVFAAIYVFLFLYLRRQRKAVWEAGRAIQEFLDGNTASRIECEQTGGWYSLFHQVNELSAILSAHAENERQTKEFLQGMISDVSHQLKTPLSALKMYQEIIGSHTADPESVIGFSQKSLREIRRMEAVACTLLKLARLDAGMIQMQKVPENIDTLMQDVLERFEVRAEQEGKVITLSGNRDVSLSCDALWISEAVGNIVKNALDHTGSGGRINISWEQGAIITKIVIEDNGTGICPEDLYNIFKRFYRSRFSQDTQGIGLGLSLAKAVVELHGGTISVASRLHTGTAFTLSFFHLTNE